MHRYGFICAFTIYENAMVMNRLKIIKPFIEGDFLKSVLKLVSGASLSQAIMMIGFILLGRLYTPTQFGLMASIVALAAIISPLLALRFEMTILIDKSKRIANMAMSICFLLAVVTLGLSTLMLYIAGQFFVTSWAPYLYAFVIIAIGNTALLISESYFNRLRAYKTMASLPVINAVIFVSTALALQHFSDGLIWALIMSNICLFTLVTIKIYTPIQQGLSSLSRKRFFYYIQRNKDFPIFSLPATLCSNLSNNVPVLLIGSLFGPAQAGLYAMMMRLLLAPIKLISATINKVFIEKISKLINTKQQIYPTSFKIMSVMAGLSMLLGLSIFIFAMLNGFSFVFGAQWTALNALTLYFIPAITVGFIARSISRFAIYRRNKMGLYYQITMTTAILSFFAISYIFALSFEQTIIGLSFTLCSLYFLQLYLVRKVSKEHDDALPK